VKRVELRIWAEAPRRSTAERSGGPDIDCGRLRPVPVLRPASVAVFLLPPVSQPAPRLVPVMPGQFGLPLRQADLVQG
jgi:hypothetical protein